MHLHDHVHVFKITRKKTRICTARLGVREREEKKKNKTMHLTLGISENISIHSELLLKEFVSLAIVSTVMISLKQK